VTLVLGESVMASVADLWPDSPCYQDHGTQLPAPDECDSVTLSMVGSSTDRERPAQRFITGEPMASRSCNHSSGLALILALLLTGTTTAIS
jgi:hypothetical protein